VLVGGFWCNGRSCLAVRSRDIRHKLNAESFVSLSAVPKIQHVKFFTILTHCVRVMQGAHSQGLAYTW
jgi:hypothetical protein